MHRKHQIAALCFLAFSVLFDVGLLEQHGILYPAGTRSGLLPLLAGCAPGGFGIIWLVQVSDRGMAEEGPSLPPRGGIVRILSIVVSVAVVSAVLDLLGSR